MDTLTLIKARKEALRKLNDRQDRTRSFLYGDPYHIMMLDGKKALDNVVNVTMPYAAIIANTIINDLMDAYRQVVVEGEISATQQHAIESFVSDSREQADEGLMNKGFPTLFEWWCNHVCVRSFIGVRWVGHIINGEYVVDCQLLDMRYCPYEYGNDGLNWVANQTWRTKAKIESQYSKLLEQKGVSIPSTPGEGFEMTDFWDGEKNEIWLGDSLLIEQKNPFGYPPFVITAPATGFMLRDKGYLEHESEDILFMVRDILNQINMSVSIEQTLSYDLLRPPYQKPVDAVRYDGKPAEAPPKTGQTKKVIKGEEYILLDRPDVNRGFLTGREDLNKVLQMGGVNDIDLGNVSQTVSAVWITAQAGIRKKFSGPRLKAISQAEQMLARMMIDQYQNAEGEGEYLIGQRGRKKTYSGTKLGDADRYAIRYEYRTQSATEEIANLAQFEAAPDLPMEWKLEHILKVDDPAGIMRKMDWQEAKRLDPAVMLSELGVSVAREAEQIEDETEADLKKLQSMMLIERAVDLLKQRLQPGETPKQPEVPERPRGNVQALMGLPKALSAGGGSVRQPREER